MSLKEKIKAWFIDHPDDVTDNEGLREALGIDDAQQVSVALNALHNEIGLKRDRKPEGGRGLDYWLPKAVAAELKLVDTVGGKAPVIRDDATPAEPKVRQKRERAQRTKKAAKKFKAAGRSKRAKPLPRISKKSKRTIKQVIRRALEPAPPQDESLDPGPATNFAIQEDGMLGISMGERSLQIPRAAVQRLRDFLETTSPLWS